jgi:hypothetical protein
MLNNFIFIGFFIFYIIVEIKFNNKKINEISNYINIAIK